MLAWINLLSDDGYINRVLHDLHLIHDPIQWLSGSAVSVTAAGINISGPVIIALAYGYMPFMIVPLYATLDRIDERQLEASRDLGSGRMRHVPASRRSRSRGNGLITAIVVTALPMFGDYYTNTLVSGSPTTTMVGNEIEFYLLGSSQKAVGASLVLILSIMLMLLMAYYLVSTSRASKEAR